MTTRCRWFRILLSLVITCWAMHPSALHAQPLTSRVVAYSGQPAPGTSTVFDRLDRPAIGTDGEIAFTARLDQPGPDGSNREGIWVDIDGTLSARYLGGDPSPLVAATLQDSFTDPTINSDGRVAFGSRVEGATLREAIWLEDVEDANGNSDLLVAAVEGDLAPGIPGGARFASLLTGAVNEHILFNNSRFVVFTAELDDLSGSPLGRSLWLANGSELHPVAAPGLAVPSVPGVTLTSIGDSVLATDDLLAFVAGVAPAAGANELALISYRRIAPNFFQPHRVALTGAGLPGLATDEVVASIQDLRINRSDQIAFTGSIESQSGSLLGSGIWVTDASGTPSLIYRDDGMPGDIWVSASRSFALLDSGQIALSSDEFLGASVRPVIFLIGSGLQRLATAGQPAADLPGLVYADFAALTANEDGRLAFFAFLDGPGVNATNDQALFAQDETGATRLIARQGDSIEVSPAVQRTISGVTLTDGTRGTGGSDGRPRGFSLDGRVIWRANFSPSGIAIMVTDLGRLPRPELHGLEVIQTIQDLNNDMPLIQHKPTLVRAHFHSEAQGVLPILRAYRSGVEIAGSPLAPAHTPTFSVDGGSRDILAESVNWHLPTDWLSDTLELEVDRVSGDIDCREAAGPNPDDCRFTAAFQPMPALQVRFVAVTYTDASGNVRTVDRRARFELAARLKSIFPIARIDWTDTEMRWPGAPPTEDDLLAITGAIKQADGCRRPACNRLYYGVVSGDEISGVSIGSVAVGKLPTDPLAEGRHTHSHEIGHLLSFPHAVHSMFAAPGGSKRGACNAIANAATPDFDNFYEVEVAGSMVQRPTLGPMESGDDRVIYGYDSLLGRLVPPSQWFELMSYCSSPIIDLWPSDVTYLGLRSTIEVQFAQANHESRAGGSEALLVRGFVDQGDVVTLLPFLGLLDVPAPSPPPAGAFTLRLYRLGGSVDDIAFEPETLHARGAPRTNRFFQIPVDPQPTIERVEIWHQGTQLASRVGSQEPRVEVVSPNGGEVLTGNQITVSWLASDSDGDALTHTVQLSTDGGTSWQTLATDVSGSSISLQRDLIPRTNLGLFRVVTSDGLLFNADVSDGTFESANNPPLIEFASPRPFALFAAGQSIVFEAQGFDTEDGNLAPAAFIWKSSLDGELGNGEQLILNSDTLTQGQHVIEVTGVDSYGAEASASRQINVRVEALFTNAFEEGNTSGWSKAIGDS